MIERSIMFGEQGGLIGTLVEVGPDIRAKADVGFIFFNAGIVHRVGVHRVNVMLARRLALQGIPSIRFDLAGVGDSARAGGQHPYNEQAVMDIQAALDALGEAAGVSRFVLYGMCSGAVHSYAAALADKRVVGMAMFDIYKYPTMKARLRQTLFRIKKHNTLSAVVKKIAVVVKRKSTHALQRLGKLGATQDTPLVSNVGFFATRPPKAEFAHGLRTLLDRGTKIILIYAGGGLDHYNYDAQFEDAFKAFGITDQIEAAFLPDMDHTATRVAAQTELCSCVERWATQFAAKPENAG
jgi:pimeloyl-ACP methyl ester carboxylesterase